MSKKKKKELFTCLIILFIFLGASIGYLLQNTLTKNDKFILNGEKNITLNINEEYKEEGVTIISYNKDISNKVIIETNLDITKKGEYYVIYKVKDSYKYKDIIRVRYITVSEEI